MSNEYDGVTGSGSMWDGHSVVAGESDHWGGTSAFVPTTAIAVEQPTDPARSEHGRIVDLLGNGPWKGLVLPDDDPALALQSIYLDDTPIQNPDLTWNHQGVYAAMVLGSNTQSHIQGFDGIESETVLQTEVKQLSPVTQQITDLTATAARVKVSVPTLLNGDKGSEVSFRISVQSLGDDGAPWWEAILPWTTTDRGGTLGSDGWQADPVPNAILVLKIPLVVSASAKTITRSSGTFLGNGFLVGHKIRLINAGKVGNQQVLEITDVSALVITCANATGLEDETISGGVVTAADHGTIKGKFTSKYVKGYMLNLAGTTGPWNIKVTKLTKDSDGDVTKQRALYFESLTVITNVLQRYPHSVMAHMVVDSRKIQRVPKRGYLCDGQIIKVPTNYDPATRTYATTGPGTTGGIWDGTFKDAFSDNPAWCFYDMCTNTLYGAGSVLSASQIDTGGLYEIAQYCDELVLDGQGGTEPRFTCNAYITQAQEAMQLLSYLASIFRGAAYWANGAVVATQDRPDTPGALFTASNVIGGKFSYSSTAKKARHTAAIIWWNDPANAYARKAEYVEDATGMARYGYNPIEVTAFGCASQGQARRLGLWTLAVELAETETVSFKCGLEGVALAPSQIISIHDPARFGARHGGRVIAATTTSVQVDSPWDILADHTYTLACVLPDGTLESRAIANSPATGVTTFTTDAFTTAPQPFAQWILTDAGVSYPLDYRVISVSEESGGELQVTALLYNASKYAAVEEGLMVAPVTYPAQYFAEPPAELTGGEVVKLYGSRYGAQLQASWTPCAKAIGYTAVAILDGERKTMAVTSSSAVLEDVPLGLYEIRVSAIYPGGRVSPQALASYEVLGQDGLAPPDSPSYVAAYVQAESLYASWRAVEDLYGLIQYEVRWGDAWDSAQVVGRTYNLSMQLPAEGTYWVAALRFNTYSTPVTLVVGSVAFLRNVVQSWDEDATGWTGTCSGAAEIASGSLTLDTSTALSGTYEVPSGHIVDIGTAQLCTVTAVYSLVGSMDTAWDDIPVFDECASVDGVVGGYVSALVEMAVADNSGTFGSWAAYQPGQYVGRKFKLRITLTTIDATVVPVLDDFVWTVDMPDRTESAAGVSVGTGGATITYATAFQARPVTHMSIRDMSNGDYFKITADDESGFTVTCYNSSGTAVARSINWSSRGY